MVSHITSTRQAVDGIRRIVQSLHESSRQAERRAGVTGAQLFVLQTLADVQALSLNELAARTHTHQSSVSVVVAKLAARRLVQRRWADADGRRREIALTPAGRKIAAHAPDPVQERLIGAISSMPARRRALFATLLDQVATAMRAERAPQMFFERRRR